MDLILDDGTTTVVSSISSSSSSSSSFSFGAVAPSASSSSSFFSSGAVAPSASSSTSVVGVAIVVGVVDVVAVVKANDKVATDNDCRIITIFIPKGFASYAISGLYMKVAGAPYFTHHRGGGMVLHRNRTGQLKVGQITDGIFTALATKDAEVTDTNPASTFNSTADWVLFNEEMLVTDVYPKSVISDCRTHFEVSPRIAEKTIADAIEARERFDALTIDVERYFRANPTERHTELNELIAAGQSSGVEAEEIRNIFDQADFVAARANLASYQLRSEVITISAHDAFTFNQNFLEGAVRPGTWITKLDDVRIATRHIISSLCAFLRASHMARYLLYYTNIDRPLGWMDYHRWRAGT